MSYMFFLNWVFSIIFLFMNHPLSLGCILLIQTILMSLISGFLYYNFWFSYILFLIMIGGMMVMFIYMTSIASNEKFKMPKKMLIFSMMNISFIIIMFILLDDFYSNLMTSMTITLSQTKYLFKLTLNKYFNYPSMLIMVSLMIYLLVTLIAIVKIIGKNTSTLRQK